MHLGRNSTVISVIHLHKEHTQQFTSSERATDCFTNFKISEHSKILLVMKETIIIACILLESNVKTL